jgi:hypothetical protein
MDFSSLFLGAYVLCVFTKYFIIKTPHPLNYQDSIPLGIQSILDVISCCQDYGIQPKPMRGNIRNLLGINPLAVGFRLAQVAV